MRTITKEEAVADTPSNPYGSPEEKPHVPPLTPPSTSGSAAVPPPPPPHNPYAQQAAAPAPKDNAQLFGIIGIVLSVTCGCAPIGALFGWLSMKESKKFGKDDTLGKVAFWLGIVATALAVIGVLLACILGAFSGSMNYDNYN